MLVEGKEIETWKSLDFLDFPNYAVSDWGEMKNVITNQILTTGTYGRGYLRTLLFPGRKYVDVHILVAKAFLMETYFEGAIVHHKDEDRGNPKYTNLEWITPAGNSQASSYKTSGTHNGMSKLSNEQVKYIREHYIKGHTQFGQCALARQFKVQQYVIFCIGTGKSYKEVK